MKIVFNHEVEAALAAGMPVVALESTVIAHGLPYPHNLETALLLESTVRENGAVPATVAVLGGDLRVGLATSEIESFATAGGIRKITRRDLPIAVGRRLDCATTVATTAFIAHRAGISVFATGGIGGIHRGCPTDVSADLPELASTPITVVCAGAKAVLDLGATREWLETHGVTILGWECDEMPAFYSRTSGLAVDERVGSASEAAAIVAARDGLGTPGAILIAVPVPPQFEIPRSELEAVIAQALLSAGEKGIRGKAVTPFLLGELAWRSAGRTLAANIALLENNARVAAAVANELVRA